jgi:dienelactone hydrolase
MAIFEKIAPLHLIAQAVDRGFLSMILRTAAKPSQSTPKVGRADLEALVAFYQNLGEAFYPSPAPISPLQQRVRSIRGGAVLDLSWESGYQPAFPEIKERYQAYVNNRIARARFFRHEQPCPVMICIHGYGGGKYSLEERAFPVEWLFSLGFDVLLPQLPFHEDRAIKESRIFFPNPSRVAITNEGFGQAIFDLRGLTHFLLRRGAPSVSVTGMSLGGYTASLLATVEPKLSFVAPMIPFASYSRLVWAHGKGGAPQERAKSVGIDEELLAEVFAIHSPLCRQPTLTPERVLLGAAEFDRVTPKEHAYWLQTHFQTPHFVLFPGGHLIQTGRRQFFTALKERARALSII